MDYGFSKHLESQEIRIPKDRCPTPEEIKEITFSFKYAHLKGNYSFFQEPAKRYGSIANFFKTLHQISLNRIPDLGETSAEESHFYLQTGLRDKDLKAIEEKTEFKTNEIDKDNVAFFHFALNLCNECKDCILPEARVFGLASYNTFYLLYIDWDHSTHINAEKVVAKMNDKERNNPTEQQAKALKKVEQNKKEADKKKAECKNLLKKLKKSL